MSTPNQSPVPSLQDALRIVAIATGDDTLRCLALDVLKETLDEVQASLEERSGGDVSNNRAVLLSQLDEKYGKSQLMGSLKNDAIRQEPIDILNFLPFSEKCLKENGIYTIGDVCELSDEQLLRIPGLGRRRVADLRSAMGAILP